MVNDSPKPVSTGCVAKPFSPWLCLSAPRIAGDENSGVAPYAVLHLRVDRAHGLPAADFTGLSDPYVKAQLNDRDLADVRTKTQKQTLAPKWQEEFHIRVFRPGSVLSIYVHDEDFGEAAKVGFAGSFIGLSDDLLGYVDISIEQLPLNTKVSGWFNLWDPEHDHRLLNYKSRASNLEKGIRPQTVGRIRLQLTLHVAQPQHELFAHCLGPPAFAEPLEQLSFAKVLGDVTVISHLIQDLHCSFSPLLEHAERFSSLLWATVLVLVWKPQFILPLLSSTACVLLFACKPEAPDREDKEAEEGYRDDPDSQQAPVEPTEKEPDITSDPALLKVFTAAEAGLPPEQYSEFASAQTNLDQVVVLVRGFEAGKAMLLSYRIPVCGGLVLLTALLIYLREWQGLLIRLLLTAAVGFLLLDQSCVARIARAFWAYRARKKPLRDFHPHDVQGANLKVPLQRRGTQVLTPNAAAALSNSPDNIHSSDSKPMHHRLQEGSWTEPKWCQHCGGFLWGVWRQGWQCSHCSVILCHSCASDADQDFCAGFQ